VLSLKLLTFENLHWWKTIVSAVTLVQTYLVFCIL